MKAFFQNLAENKKMKNSDALWFAKFASELIRRYPSTTEMFEEEFNAVFAQYKTQPKQPVNRMLFFVYCELCLFGCIGKENIIGKILRLFSENVAHDAVLPHLQWQNPSITQLMICFAVQYGFEFIGVYPTYLSSELLIQEELQKYPPLIQPSLQSRFLSLFADYHSALVKKVGHHAAHHAQGNEVWELLSQCHRDVLHQTALRGVVSEELEAKEKDATQQMKELKNQSDFWNSSNRRISVLSKALNLEEPQYVEEDIQTRSGFEVFPRESSRVVADGNGAEPRLYGSFRGRGGAHVLYEHSEPLPVRLLSRQGRQGRETPQSGNRGTRINRAGRRNAPV